MADKKSSEDEFTDENFDDEFEFEEETREPDAALSTVSKGNPQKYVVLGISIAVLAFIGYFGYRFFYAKQASPSLAQSTVTQTASASNVKPSQTTGKASSTKPTTPAPTTAGLPGKTQPGAITEQDLAGPLNSKATAAPPKEPKEVAFEKQKEMAATLGQPEKQVEKQKEAALPQQPEILPAVANATTVNPVSSQATSAATPSNEGAKPAEPSKLAEPTKPTDSSPSTDLKKAEGIAEAVITEAPKSEPLPLGEPTATAAATAATTIAAGTTVPTPHASAAATPSASVSASETTPSPPPNAVEMQAFHQQTQKTLEAFTKLNQQMENNLNQIKYLDSYTREVSLNVEKLSAQVTAMDNRIQALTHLANSLSKDLGKVRNEVGYVKRVIGDEGPDIATGAPTGRQRNMDYPYPNALEDGIDCATAPRKKGGAGIRNEDLEYVVHAVIPGRAWLKSAKGQIITVTEGENLGNYGKILVIDASNGVVLTSSGITFR